MTRQKRNTGLFIGFLLLAGVANVFSRTGIPFLDTLMTCINYVTFLGLLLYWIESVRVRLLPSAARRSILTAAFFMLLYMTLRIFKYRFSVSVIAMRYAVYAYWIPQMFIPALFLMTCILIQRGEQGKGKWNENLLLISATVLSFMVMTNDLHSLVYVYKIDLDQFVVNTGTYSYGPGFYIMYVWMGLTMLFGLGLLFHEAGHLPKKAVGFFMGLVILWVGFVLLILLVIDRYFFFRFFNIPEVHIFALLAIFEICIRFRLIPYNENYSGFFRKLRIPSVITDRQFHPAYSTETAITANPNDLQAALTAPVDLPPDLKLFGEKIRAGYAFWTVDESTVHQSQERLIEANEMIEQENDLIRAETEQKERDAYLQSRHRIYHEIAEKLYPCQKRITQLLNETVPGTDSFKKKIAMVSVLNAYVKRKTNFLLLASEHEYLNLGELFLALQESANYLTLAGLQTKANYLPEEGIETKEKGSEDGSYPANQILALYDAFEAVAEQLIGKAPSLMVSLNETGLRLAAETEELPDTAGITLPVQFRQREDILFMEIFAEKGGEMA